MYFSYLLICGRAINVNKSVVLLSLMGLHNISLSYVSRNRHWLDFETVVCHCVYNVLCCNSFCPTDAKYASCSDDGTVRVWDFLRCHEERIMRGAHA